MRIDINLLQRSEKKERQILIYVIVFSLIVIFTALMFIIQSEKNKKQLLSEELQQIKQEIELIEQNVQTVESLSAIHLLQSAITVAEKEDKTIIPILQHFTSILPQQGYIQSLHYVNYNEFQLEIQFNQHHNAAYYLAELNRTKWITSATLQSINQLNTNVAQDEKGKGSFLAYYSISLDNQLAGRK